MYYKVVIRIAFLLFFTLVFSEASGNNRPDSLFIKLEQPDLTAIEKGKIYFHIGTHYYVEVEDAKLSKKYFSKSYSLLKNTCETETYANSVNYLGICYEVTGNHDSAIYYFNKYLDISNEQMDSVAIETLITI